MAIEVEEVFDVSSRSERRVVKELVRDFIVKGLTASDGDGYAAQISQSSAIPRGAVAVNGSLLYYDTEEMDAGDDTPLGYARVRVTYKRGEGTTVTDPEGNSYTVPTLQGGTTLKQVETYLDRDKNQMEVSYRYPEDSNEIAPDQTPLAGKLEKQKGTIRVLVPMTTLEGSLRFRVPDPLEITKAYTGRVNAAKWRDGEPRTWMCTSATFKLVDDSVSPPVYDLFFRFEYDDQTWDNDTTLAFRLRSTGGRPGNASFTDEGGLKKIEYYPAKDFNADFGN